MIPNTTLIMAYEVPREYIDGGTATHRVILLYPDNRIANTGLEFSSLGAARASCESMRLALRTAFPDGPDLHHYEMREDNVTFEGMSIRELREGSL